GGYISMAGMFPPARQGGKARTASTGFFDTLVQDARTSSGEEIRPGDEDRVFYKLPVWKRIVVMLGGPFMNLVIAVVLYAVVICGFGLPQVSLTVGSVSECIIPATSDRTECADDDQPSPAAAAGVQAGDTIVSVNGQPAADWTTATEVIRSSAGTPVTLVVERAGAEVSLTLTPEPTQRPVYDENGEIVRDENGDPVTEEVGIVGISPAYVNVPQPVTTVLPAVGDNIVAVAKIIVTLPQRLWQVGEAAFGGGERVAERPIGVVGIGRLAGEITSYQEAPIINRIAQLTGMLASLNVALFVFNLIPLLPLDGGHIAGALWEGLRRRIAKLRGRPDPGPVDTARLVPITLVVTGVLAVMTLLLIYADIVNPISFL
ncbi:MAG: site-2 protease family protein, partial [Thermoleophilia bacterium]|nr:site-2 protease family protein [Thermoleophilia bacterium]